MANKFRPLIDQYLRDPVAKEHWLALDVMDDVNTIRTIFLEGACFDFANALAGVTGWPVYEIQWGAAMPDDPDECDTRPGSDWGVHRVVRHPSGRYLDASGWTDLQATLARIGCLDATYQWMGAVDADGGVYDVDFDLVEKAVIALLPEDACLSTTKKPKSSASFGM